MTTPVICAYARSPFTLAQKGALAGVRPDDILGQTLKALVARANISPQTIEDVLVGCAFPEGEQGLNIARNAVFLADLPVQVAGATINRFCGSSMEAAFVAAGAIARGAGDAFLAAGVESMTRVPMGGFNPLPNPALYARDPQVYISMGKTAENLAKQYSIARDAQERFALQSHQRAAAANLAEEIIAIDDVNQDGCVRADTSLEKMATLPPVFDANGSVTAATSAPLTDGASALLLCAESFADAQGLPKLARLRAQSVVGLRPEVMGLGPVEASRKALARAGLSLKDMDVIEINEAFAAQVLACCGQMELDPARVNREGGALAFGHPLGASGARILGKAAQQLARGAGRYALATLCVGGGQGMAAVLEKI